MELVLIFFSKKTYRHVLRGTEFFPQKNVYLNCYKH